MTDLGFIVHRFYHRSRLLLDRKVGCEPLRRSVFAFLLQSRQSLTPLSVAGCGRLQPEVAHRANSVALMQVVDI